MESEWRENFNRVLEESDSCDPKVFFLKNCVAKFVPRKKWRLITVFVIITHDWFMHKCLNGCYIPGKCSL